MRSVPRDVAVTGAGATSALGATVPALWAAVESGRGGITTIRRFATDALSVHTGALVDGSNGPGWARSDHDLCRDFAVRAGREALASAGVSGRCPPERIALVLGTGLTDASQPLNALVESVADTLGIAGVRLAVSTACSSSTGALGLGCELLELEAADVVLAGGADVLTPEVLAGFHALGVLTPGACAPFSTPAGTTLGEGAGFLVLERGLEARARGATPRATIAGYGLSGDAWHETSPDPKGKGVERAIRSALVDAGLEARRVGYVNAHGSGTEANDSAEWLGISHALGPREVAVPVSSTKGALGHAQGAAGVLEAIVTLEAMSRGLLPPTLNFVAPRPHGPPDPVPGPTPRPTVYDCAVSVNSAFGGANAAVVLSRYVHRPVPGPRRPVAILGLGLLGGFGCGPDAFLASPPEGRRSRGRVEGLDIGTFVPGTDPRGLDPASAFLTAAAALALSDAHVSLAGERRDRCGLLVGQCRPSPTSLRAFSDSIAQRGLAQLSAAAFARIVLNAAAGFCSKLLSVRGPLCVVSTGSGSGLSALALAAQLVATRADLSLMLAGAVDERPVGGDEGPGDGAACVLLGAADDARPGNGSPPAVRLAGWGLAGPGRLDEAVRRAAPGGLPPDALVIRPQAGDNGAADTLFALAEAVLELRRGAARSALVASGSGRSLAAAVHLGR
jgi:3-oxoacyl-[acyl-carrier-protein] synthase II